MPYLNGISDKSKGNQSKTQEVKNNSGLLLKRSCWAVSCVTSSTWSQPQTPARNNRLAQTSVWLFVSAFPVVYYQNGSVQRRRRHWRYLRQRGGAPGGFLCSGWKRLNKLFLFSGKTGFLHRSPAAIAVIHPTLAFLSAAVLDALLCVCVVVTMS